MTLLRLVRSCFWKLVYYARSPLTLLIGIVGPPADDLLGYEGVEGAQGPRFRKLSPQEIEDYLTNL